MRFLAFIGALAVIAATGAAVYLFGGYYNVAAAEEDAGPVAWVLQRVRTASVSRHAAGQPPFALDDAAVKAGAGIYARAGCTNCHGGPGVKWAKFSEGLNPDPPDLKEQAKVMTAPHIFWVVKNGIRMTGMPSFEKGGLDDKEIWQVAAFVKKLPSVSEADYKAWTGEAATAAGR